MTFLRIMVLVGIVGVCPVVTSQARQTAEDISALDSPMHAALSAEMLEEEAATPGKPTDDDERDTPGKRQDDRAAARAKALEDGWPDTPAGIMASRWVEAFSTGEDAMRQFLEESLSEDSLAKRPMQERLEKIATLHEQIGGLLLASVVESETTRLAASLLSDSGAKHTFVFQLTEGTPHKLVSISMMHAGGHGHARGH
jgi:hypothetical protein